MTYTGRKYRKGNEYAYRIYELDTRKILCNTDRKISKGLQISNLLTGHNLLLVDEYENTPNFGITESLVLWN